MAKHVGNLRYTDLQPFPAATISRLQHKIATHQASINYKYTILLIGTNISPSLLVGEIMSYYENLVTFIKLRSTTILIISAIIPRPCDLRSDLRKAESNKLIKSFKPCVLGANYSFCTLTEFFLRNNHPVCSLFAVQDGGLHLNAEGTRKLRQFLSTQLHT